jgi:hypothetical protein
MSEHQIVRPLRRGESLPPVATLDLIMPEYCHVAYSARSIAAIQDMERVRRHNHVEPRCPKNHNLIVQMLSERKPCREIAKSVGVNIQAVQRYIRKHKLGKGMMNNRDIARTNADEIWKLYRSGMHQTVIAERLGTNRASVNELICGKL